MTDSKDIDYGPLSDLFGIWKGDKGLDVAPEPDGAEKNPYYETITFTPAGDVTNADSQVIAAVHYRQIVQRKTNDKIFHDETGYWMWDAAEGIVMHSLTIPRAVSVLAGGVYVDSESNNGITILEVSANIDDKNWQIIQSPFMLENAKTTSFYHRVCVGNGVLSYSETTMLDIYGEIFEHTDKNELVIQ